MYFVIIATIVVPIICFIKNQIDWNWKDWLSSFYIFFAAAATTLLVSLIMTFAFTAAAYDEDNLVPTKTVETELVALNDDMGSYLYSGYVDEEFQYSYLYNVPGKGVTSKTIKANKCYIIESENPKLITTTYAVDTNWFVDFFTFDTLLEETEYTLFVPNGSISGCNKEGK